MLSALQLVNINQKMIYPTFILHISYIYQYPIYIVLYNINAKNPTHIVVI
jgi:hypothetical protein